jgi:hypothetical protein
MVNISREVLLQQRAVTNWNNAVKKTGVVLNLLPVPYIDLTKDPDAVRANSSWIQIRKKQIT